MARANADELMSMQTVSKSDNVAQYSTVYRSVQRGKGRCIAVQLCITVQCRTRQKRMAQRSMAMIDI